MVKRGGGDGRESIMLMTAMGIYDRRLGAGLSQRKWLGVLRSIPHSGPSCVQS